MHLGVRRPGRMALLSLLLKKVVDQAQFSSIGSTVQYFGSVSTSGRNLAILAVMEVVARVCEKDAAGIVLWRPWFARAAHARLWARLFAHFESPCSRVGTIASAPCGSQGLAGLFESHRPALTLTAAPG